MEQEMKRYYVTNVDTEVTVFQKTGKIAVINNSAQAQHTELYIKGKCAYVLDLKPAKCVGWTIWKTGNLWKAKGVSYFIR